MGSTLILTKRQRAGLDPITPDLRRALKRAKPGDRIKLPAGTTTGFILSGCTCSVKNVRILGAGKGKTAIRSI